MADAPPVETYAILPIAKYKAMEQRLKKSESEMKPEESHSSNEAEEAMEAEADVATTSKDSEDQAPNEGKKDVKLKYRKAQIRKLLHHVERLEGGQEITSLENIDQLIQSALGASKKILPNESKFFSFLFDNNMAHFVKNRWKIRLYYKDRDNWFQI